MTKQEPLVAYTLPSTPVLMEQLYQNLSAAPSQPGQALRRASGPLYELTARRLRQAGEQAQPYLNKRICAALDLDEGSYAAFLTGDEEVYPAVRDGITGFLGHTGPVPHDKRGNDRGLAIKWLVKAMTQQLLKQHTASNPTLPLAYPTLSRFMEGSHVPTQPTMQAIRVFLRLEDEEYQTIYRLTRKHYLYGLERVRDKVNQEWGLWKRRMKRGGQTGSWESLEAFWNQTAVSPKAMRGLGCVRPKEGEEKPPVGEKTTQGTMLKLTVAFRFDPVRAEGFLAQLDSGFYDLRDMLFCSCLYLKIFEPLEVNALLEPYAYNRADPSKPRFDNPYLQAFGEDAEK